jgi:hypothetical protein
MLIAKRCILIACISGLITACAPIEKADSPTPKALTSVPQIEFSKFAIGDYVIFDQSNIGLSRYTVTKFENGLYTFEGRMGEDGSGSLLYRAIDTVDGKRHRLETDRTTMVYHPHSCFRAVGSCSYVATDVQTGNQKEYTIEGKINGDRYEWDRYHHGKKVSYGWTTFDAAFGLPLEYEITQGKLIKGHLVKIARAADPESDL